MDKFFATRRGAQFNDYEHRDLLESLLDTGMGDPLRWSAARVALTLDGSPYHHDELSLEVMLDAPDLLRAFVPFAHAQSGIRQDLTADTVAAIDDLAPGYRRAVLKPRSTGTWTTATMGPNARSCRDANRARRQINDAGASARLPGGKLEGGWPLRTIGLVDRAIAPNWAY